MARTRKSTLLEDMSVFSRMAALLEGPEPPSFRTLATEMETTEYILKSTIERLSLHLRGAKLIHTAEKIASATGLTDEGRRFYEEIRRLEDWKPPDFPEVRLAIAHSLFTSRLLSPTFRQFREKSDCSISLQTRVEMDFSRIISDIQSDRLDLAIWFSNDRRNPDSYPGIDSAFINKTLFDVVLIGPHPFELKKHYKKEGILASLSTQRVAALHSSSQPGVTRLPQPDRLKGGERLEFDTIDAVIASVSSGIADVGLVVANYDFLEELGLSGSLFFSDPIDKTRLVYFRSSRSRLMAKKLVTFIEENFDNLPMERNRFLESYPGAKFPTEVSLYESLKFGYYIDQPRGRDRDRGFLIPKWNEERIELRHTLLEVEGLDEGQIAFEGRITNEYSDVFSFHARRIHDHVFYVGAIEPELQSIKKSVNAFCSVFTYYLETDDNSILFGHWAGRDAEDEMTPAIYSTILSRRPLEAETLRQLSRALKGRVFRTAETR